MSRILGTLKYKHVSKNHAAAYRLTNGASVCRMAVAIIPRNLKYSARRAVSGLY